MKKILFPLAFSENAPNIFLFALDWAAKFDASIVVMHSLGLSKIQKEGTKNWDELTRKTMLKMEEFVKENTPSAYQSIQVTYVLPIGFAATEIENVAKTEEIDLIVMGMKAHRTAISSYFSSVAIEVVSWTNIPVLLIPETTAFLEIKNMVYTFDLQLKELAIIQQLLKWVKQLEANLSCLHVVESNEQLSEKEIEMAAVSSLFYHHKKHQDRISFYLTEGNFERVVKHTSVNHGMDLLVMLSHHRNFKTRWVQPSTAIKIVRSVEVPILSLIHI